MVVEKGKKTLKPEEQAKMEEAARIFAGVIIDQYFKELKQRKLQN